jgi:murein DD-endopeptidase MepM/ murein hydrolase activator NlpD
MRRDPFNGGDAMHYGVDFGAALRTPVHATAPGVVSFAGWGGDYGNLVEIDHGLGIRTRYGHLSRIDVRQGESVGARARVGLLGSTGRSTGPHLHYEVIFEEENLDPLRFIEARRLIVRSPPRERRPARG